MALPKTKKTIVHSDNKVRSVGKATQPRSKFDKVGSRMAGGEIMNYPFSSESMHDATKELDSALTKMQVEEKYRLAEV